MAAGRVELRIEIETEGAEQLTTLRSELDRLGSAGAASFAQLDRSVDAVVDKLALSRQLVQNSTRSFLDSQRQLVAGLGPLFDGFFRGVFAGSRSLTASLKRLWRDFLDFFLALVRQMVGAWFSGLQAMGFGPRGFGGLGGGLGGVFAGLLGGLFGLPGAAGLPGGTPPTFPGLSLSQFASSGLGLVLGPGGRLPRIGGAGGLVSLSGIAGLLGLTGFGLAGAGIGRGSVLLGGLGGFLAGGALGTLLGSAGALSGTALGAFAGPIGAAIGLIVGGLLAALRRGKLKRQASRVADQGFAAMQRVIQEFEQFRIDYETALTQVTQVWQQMVAAWERMGKVGQRSIRSQQPWFEAVLKRLNDLQRARELRTQAIAALPIPEFQRGGIVSALTAGDGRLLAFLHQGEAVLNRRAVQALGEERIERLNRGLGADGLTVQLVFPAVHDPRGFEEALRRNEAALVRLVRRAARDRGLPPPL